MNVDLIKPVGIELVSIHVVLTTHVLLLQNAQSITTEQIVNVHQDSRVILIANVFQVR